MRKENGFLQRLGALLLTAAMLIGMCPLTVAAEGEDTPVLLSIQLVGTQLNAEGSKITEGESVDKYMYKVEFVDNPIVNEAQAEYYWLYDGVPESGLPYTPGNGEAYYEGSSSVTLDSEPTEIMVYAKVDGLYVKAEINASNSSWSNGNKYSPQSTWKAGISNLGLIGVMSIGVPVTLDAAKATGTCGSDRTPVASIDWNGLVIEQQDSTYTAALSNGQKSARVTVKYYNNSTLRWQETKDVTVDWPNYDADFVVNGTTYKNGDTVCVTAAPAVTVTIPKDTTNGTIAGSQYLPNDIGTWSETGDGWTTTVNNFSGDLAVGNESITVVVDNQLPSITNGKAYVTDSGTAVDYDTQSGPSGVKSVTVQNQTVEPSSTFHPKVTLPDTSLTSVSVKLTSGAGRENTQSIPVTPALKISSCELTGVDTTKEGDTYYANQEGSFLLKLQGVPSDNMVKINGSDKTVSNGQITLSFAEANGKTLTVVDSLGRQAQTTVTNYVIDKIAPSVTYTPIVGGIYGTEKTIEFKAEDNAGGSGFKSAYVVMQFTNRDSSEKFYLTGAAPQKTVTLADGDVLTNISVTDIVDKLGNQAADINDAKNIVIDTKAPEVTLTASSNIESFKTFGGKQWAVLPPVTDNETGDGEDVSITACIEDKNMDATALIATGWEQNGTTFTKTFSVSVDKQANGQLPVSIPAIDLAGNKPDSVTVQAGDGSTAALTWNTTEKAFVGILDIDRRIPSENESDDVPKVTFSTTDTNYGTADSELYKDSVTFTATIQDGGSGISQVTPSVNFGTVVQGTVVGTKYPFTVTAPTDSETDNAVLSVEVSDNVGNTYTYTHAFAIDAKDPVVAVTPSITEKAENVGVKYYDADVTYTVTATDAFPATTVMEKDGEVFTGLSGGQFTVADKMDSFEVSMKDKVGKTSSASVGKMVVDKVDPVITVTIQDAGGNTVNPADGVVNSDLTYHFKVTEPNLKTLTLKYTINDGAEQTKTLTDFSKNNDLYTYSVPLTDGQRMTSWSVAAEDWAARSASAEKSGDENLLVDTTAPKVEVTESETPMRSSGVSYFDTETVTYTITVKDANLDADKTKASVTITDSNGNDLSKTITFGTVDGNLVGTFELTNGLMLSQMTIDVQDQGTNRPEKITAPDDMVFAGNSGVFTSAYTAVVDTAAPTATLSIVSQTEGVTVTGIYTFGGRNYLKLAVDEAKDVTVKATLKLSDANLTDPTNLSGWEIVPGDALTVNNANNTITLTKTLTASKDDTNAITLSLTEKDVLGHPLTKDAVSGGAGDNTPSYQTVTENSGIVTFDLTLDNRAPTTGGDSEAPVISVAPNADYTTADGKPLYNYNAEFSFTAKVKEDTDNKSGLDRVYYEVTDGSSVVTAVNNAGTDDIGDGVYEKDLTIPVNLTVNPGETNSAKLKIQAKDKSGNGVELVKDFAVDNLAPRVSVSFGGDSATNGNFFNAPRTATVTVKDINLTDTVATVSGNNNGFDGAWTGTVSEKVNTVTFDPGDGEVGEYTMSLSSTDRANNTTNDGDVDYATAGCIAPNSFIIDRKAPTVKVTRTSAATGYTTTAGTDETDFYNQPVTYTFTIQDNYLKNAGEGSQKLNISYTLNGAEKQVSLPASMDSLGGLVYTLEDGLDTYTYSFTLNNENVLSGITVEVVDNAGNSFQQITGNVPFTNGTYTGNKVKVDTEAPVVKVERTGGAAVQTVDGYEIFGQAQTFTVTVMDKNLVDTDGSIYKVHYILNNENGEQNEQEVLLTGETTRTGSFEVTGSVSDLIQLIQLLVKDAAGNSAVLHGTSNVSFGKVEGKEGLVNTGNKMVVDSLAPTATFYAKGPEIDYYYTNGSGAVFIKLKNPTDGTETDKGDVEVTACLEISDWNLSFNKAAYTVQSNNGGTLAGSDADDWNEGVKIHKDGKVVYTKTFSVPYNETRLIQLDMDISDMAGHKLEQSGLTIQSLNGTMPDKYPLTVTNGKLTGAITLDRRQPTSGSDTAAPYIEMNPTAESKYTTSSNGRKLFNKDFAYSLYVTDGEDMTLNAGLRSVVWTLENAAGVNSPSFITVNSGNGHIAQGVMETNETISFTVGTDECNTCELHVTAEDYVGNKITYVELFAVDTLAPRVKVEYDNNDVKNELYFKADRKATITVEDINFDASATKINTQVGSSGWTHSANGLVHTAVCSYTVDGEYTFTMESTDLAGNATTDSNVTYIGAAPQKFILDKTRPVIEVMYNPAEHTGIDDMGTLYYNVNTTATVRIKERNFRANDVISEFNNGKKLGAFTDGGNDSHSASVLFDQNNRYHFRISYTDLAGNVADPYSSPIFSVDTTPPVIDITKGDMTNEHLNIVPDDLVLQIRVMDQESNLESYAVKITYQNNSFEWITLNSGDYWTVTSEDGGNTIYINFANILKEKSRDGIYTVEVSGRDYAGNVTELTPPLVFSLNRFGSSFMSRDPFTIDFLRTATEGIAYHNSVDQRLVFLEINPNRVFEDAEHKLEGSALTLMVNGASKRLQRDQDYTVTREEHNAEDQAWFVYTYTIEPAAFMDGGELRNGRNTILIYGEDEAGNRNTNESNTAEITNLADGEMYTGKIEFVLDTMPPIITTVGIESNGVYEAESQQMKIDVSDSTPVAVKVYLNDQELTLSQEPGDNSVVWMTRDETMGTYTVNVPQDNNLFAKQTLRVTVVDAANNEAEAYVREFYVTTNPFIQLMNNIWLLGVGVLVLAGVIFLTVVTIRKRKTKAVR